ncbi:hypothetical protein [Paraburkholderia youngii]|uniref:hypothetical protein n=1 Tax=Paraburkholderia youngii TaxID=2782701 RepID=UPI003D192E7C
MIRSVSNQSAHHAQELHMEQRRGDTQRSEQQSANRTRSNRARLRRVRQRRALEARLLENKCHKPAKRGALKSFRAHSARIEARKHRDARAERARSFANQRGLNPRDGLSITDQGGNRGGQQRDEDEQHEDHFGDEELDPLTPEVKLSQRPRGASAARALADAGIATVSVDAVPPSDGPEAVHPHGAALAQLAEGLLAVRGHAIDQPQAPWRPLVAKLQADYQRATHATQFEELSVDELKRVLLEARAKRAAPSGEPPTLPVRELNLLLPLILHNVTRSAPSSYKLRAADVGEALAVMPAARVIALD